MTTRPSGSLNSKRIPPPPGPEDGYDAIIAYFNKYTTEELERAGYLTEPSPEEVRELAASAEYWFLCKDGLRLKLPRKDYERLSRLAAREDVTVEILVKKWIVQRLREEAKPIAQKR